MSNLKFIPSYKSIPKAKPDRLSHDEIKAKFEKIAASAQTCEGEPLDNYTKYADDAAEEFYKLANTDGKEGLTKTEYYIAISKIKNAYTKYSPRSSDLFDG